MKLDISKKDMWLTQEIGFWYLLYFNVCIIFQSASLNKKTSFEKKSSVDKLRQQELEIKALKAELALTNEDLAHAKSQITMVTPGNSMEISDTKVTVVGLFLFGRLTICFLFCQ